ncbi:MAG: HNH endonuclease signature motif containing protein, partial [Nostocoides sp.]
AFAPTATAAGATDRLNRGPAAASVRAEQASVTAQGQVVNDAAADLFTAARRLGRAGAASSTADWLEILAECAAAKARIEATQTLALAQVAAIDIVDAGTDDGSWVEQHRGLGHIRYDAPELVAPILGLTPSGAEGKVRQAVALMTRIPTVVSAMSQGRGDAYRAGIVADELAEAPVAEARAVAAALVDRFGAEAGGRLRARIRHELNKINPELVRHQCLKTRSNIGLQRWVNGDGTDTWQVHAPTETSRAAYAAVNDVALQVKKATGANIAEARATALFQLVLGQATGSYHVHVGIPVSTLEDAAVAADGHDDTYLVEVTGMDAPGSTYVPRAWLADLLAGTLDRTRPDSTTSGATGKTSATTTATESQTEINAATAAAGDDEPRPRRPPEPTSPAEQATASDAAGNVVPAQVDGVGCDDETGGYSTGPVDPKRKRPSPGWLTNRYQPTKAIRAAVIARDGHCRFPGCHANARLCDLDHVIAWPAGPTTPTNLVLLCRRHHRIKQRRGWSVRLHPDGTLTWTTPHGQRLATTPVDHLAAFPRLDRLAGASARDERQGPQHGDAFDIERDRLDEVIAGSVGAARHSQSTLEAYAVDVHTVLFTDCPIAWEFTGDWHDCADAQGKPATERKAGESSNRDQSDLYPARPASWSDDTCAEGDEPPF